MTVQEAIQTLQNVGRVEVQGDKICCRIPKRRTAGVHAALDAVSGDKYGALQLLRGAPKGEPSSLKGAHREPLDAVLKGTAIGLFCDELNQTLWLVADSEDARKLGEPLGSVFTAEEIRLVVAIGEPDIVRDVVAFKRAFNVPMRRPDVGDVEHPG